VFSVENVIFSAIIFILQTKAFCNTNVLSQVVLVFFPLSYFLKIKRVLIT